MKIRALFFATYRDLAGHEAMEVELRDGASAADLVASLRARGDALARLPARPAVARNLEYVSLDTALSDGDEVAFIPPVAGG